MNMRYRIHIILLILGILTAGIEAQELSFRLHGNEVRKISHEDLGHLVGVKTVQVFDINQKEIVEYEAVAVKDVFSSIYGERWKTEQEVLFTCKDGYQPTVPRARFDQFEAYFAIGKKGAKSFSLTNKAEGGKTVDLGPLYLIWNFPKDQQNLDNGLFWPYELVAVDLIAFADRLQGLHPAGATTGPVERGYVAFRNHCAVCHRLNGVGGQIGPELNYPKNVTEYYKPDFLSQWISNPAQIRYRSPMPGLSMNIKNREGVIKDIIAYLKAMAQFKRHPDENGEKTQ